MIDRAAAARHKNKLETLRDFIQVKLSIRPVSRVAAREPSARAHRVPAACRQVVGLQVWIVRGSIGVPANFFPCADTGKVALAECQVKQASVI
jgi:hypothetical protein